MASLTKPPHHPGNMTTDVSNTMGWETAESRRSSGFRGSSIHKRRSLSDSQIFSNHRRTSSLSSCSGYANDEAWDNITSASSAFSGPSAMDDDDGFVSGGKLYSNTKCKSQECEESIVSNRKNVFVFETKDSLPSYYYIYIYIYSLESIYSTHIH